MTGLQGANFPEVEFNDEHCFVKNIKNGWAEKMAVNAKSVQEITTAWAGIVAKVERNPKAASPKIKEKRNRLLASFSNVSSTVREKLPPSITQSLPLFTKLPSKSASSVTYVPEEKSYTPEEAKQLISEQLFGALAERAENFRQNISTLKEIKLLIDSWEKQVCEIEVKITSSRIFYLTQQLTAYNQLEPLLKRQLYVMILYARTLNSDTTKVKPNDCLTEDLLNVIEKIIDLILDNSKSLDTKKEILTDSLFDNFLLFTNNFQISEEGEIYKKTDTLISLFYWGMCLIISGNILECINKKELNITIDRLKTYKNRPEFKSFRGRILSMDTQKSEDKEFFRQNWFLSKRLFSVSFLAANMESSEDSDTQTKKQIIIDTIHAFYFAFSSKEQVKVLCEKLAVPYSNGFNVEKLSNALFQALSVIFFAKEDGINNVASLEDKEYGILSTCIAKLLLNRLLNDFPKKEIEDYYVFYEEERILQEEHKKKEEPNHRNKLEKQTVSTVYSQVIITAIPDKRNKIPQNIRKHLLAEILSKKTLATSHERKAKGKEEPSNPELFPADLRAAAKELLTNPLTNITTLDNYTLPPQCCYTEDEITVTVNETQTSDGLDSLAFTKTLEGEKIVETTYKFDKDAFDVIISGKCESVKSEVLKVANKIKTVTQDNTVVLSIEGENIILAEYCAPILADGIIPIFADHENKDSSTAIWETYNELCNSKEARRIGEQYLDVIFDEGNEALKEELIVGMFSVVEIEKTDNKIIPYNGINYTAEMLIRSKDDRAIKNILYLYTESKKAAFAQQDSAEKKKKSESIIEVSKSTFSFLPLPPQTGNNPLTSSHHSAVTNISETFTSASPKQ